jgi:hypothetical protein
MGCHPSMLVGLARDDGFAARLSNACAPLAMKGTVPTGDCNRANRGNIIMASHPEAYRMCRRDVWRPTGDAGWVCSPSRRRPRRLSGVHPPAMAAHQLLARRPRATMPMRPRHKGPLPPRLTNLRDTTTPHTLLPPPLSPTVGGGWRSRGEGNYEACPMPLKSYTGPVDMVGFSGNASCLAWPMPRHVRRRPPRVALRYQSLV